MSAEDDKVYGDLIGFLKSNRTDLRVAAIDAVMAVKDREGMAKLIRYGAVAPLAKSCSHPDPVGVNALHALVYLTSSSGPVASQCVEDLLDSGAVGRTTEIGLSRSEGGDDSSWKKRINWAMALLANLTRTERGAIELVGRSLPDKAVFSTDVEGGNVKLPTKPTLELLLSRFLSNEYIEDEDEKDYDEYESHEWDSRYQDPYQHIAAVLMNSTQTEAGRRWMMRRHESVDRSKLTSILQSLLPQLRSTNPIRRRGVAGTIKNCCLEVDSAWWLIEEVSLAKHILYPLAGPEELDVDEKRGLDPDLWLDGPDKVREPDHYARLYLVESILLLCASGRKSRESLRLARVYVILKWADMVEEHEDVSERINECVQFLRRDEAGTSEGSSDQMVEDALRVSKRLALPSTAHQVGGGSPDYDDVD